MVNLAGYEDRCCCCPLLSQIRMGKENHILLLWDIDGTLLLTRGVAGRLMVRATEEEIGKKIPYDVRVFIGATDRAIIRMLLENAGERPQNVDAVIDRILQRYISRLRPALQRPGVMRVLPGVKELVERAASDPRFAQAVLTGNVKQGARIKLEVAGLAHYLPVGAYGDDHVDRNHLAPVAIRRAVKYYGREFLPRNIWIIGDSPRDISCARANGIRVLAVATGKPSQAELAEFQPDALFPDLRNTEALMALFKSGSSETSD